MSTIVEFLSSPDKTEDEVLTEVKDFFYDHYALYRLYGTASYEIIPLGSKIVTTDAGVVLRIHRYEVELYYKANTGV